MLADKIKFVTDKLAPLMPPKDGTSFRSLMYQYVKMLQSGSTNLPAPNTNNKKLNALASAILNNLSAEKMNPNMGASKKGYGVYPSYYWNYPWYWNYWYYNWSPYYWWTWDPYPYDGISYIGGSKKVGGSNCNGNGTGALDNIMDSAVDIQSMNLNCDDNRVCDFNVRFTKAPLYTQAIMTNSNSNNGLLNGNGFVNMDEYNDELLDINGDNTEIEFTN